MLRCYNHVTVYYAPVTVVIISISARVFAADCRGVQYQLEENQEKNVLAEHQGQMLRCWDAGLVSRLTPVLLVCTDDNPWKIIHGSERAEKAWEDSSRQ